MRITGVDILHGDGGWQTWSLLKLSTDEGIDGWSEFTVIRVGPLVEVVRAMAEGLVGSDPREIGAIRAKLDSATRLLPGGLNARAAAAVENACLDIKAKALGVPVHELFGGTLRQRIPLYWSHCGLYRAMVPELFETELGTTGVRRLEDLRTVASEAADKGYRQIKTNLLPFDGPDGTVGPSLMRRGLDPARRFDPALGEALLRQVAAMREGAGEAMGLMVDLNFSFKPAGFAALVRMLGDAGLAWLELDLYDPAALADIRARAPMPIASLEAVYGARALLPYLQARSVDFAIVDMMWNGMNEAMRMAALADVFGVNVAVHTAGSPFHAIMGAHYAAAIPNLEVLEFDADIVPWAGEVFGTLPEVSGGAMAVPQGPGWGVSIDEDALRDHPPRHAS